MPHSSFGDPCKAKTKTVTFEGFAFSTPRNPLSPAQWAGAKRETVRVPVDERIASIVAYLMRSSIEAGYAIRNGATWGIACRRIRGGTSWSNHAWGLAVDLNSDRNPMVARRGRSWFHPELTDMPEWLVELWGAWGFEWGGYYKNTADAMHLEFKKLTTTDAKRLSAKAAELFLAGAWGFGPDGKAITPTAATGAALTEAFDMGMVCDAARVIEWQYAEARGASSAASKDGGGKAHYALHLGFAKDRDAAVAVVNNLRTGLGLAGKVT